jgi:hypothetical protein
MRQPVAEYATATEHEPSYANNMYQRDDEPAAPAPAPISYQRAPEPVAPPPAPEPAPPVMETPAAAPEPDPDKPRRKGWWNFGRG